MTDMIPHLYIGVLRADISVSQVWEVLEVQDEGFGFFFWFRLGQDSNGAMR